MQDRDIEQILEGDTVVILRSMHKLFENLLSLNRQLTDAEDQSVAIGCRKQPTNVKSQFS